jgi:hypothetical protein
MQQKMKIDENKKKAKMAVENKMKQDISSFKQQELDKKKEN